MHPSMSIAAMPMWLSAILFVILPAGITFILPILIRRKVPLERLKINNEVAGFKYATLGVIYAVVLAFVVIIVWEDYRNADDCVREEATSLITLYHLANVFPGSVKTSLQEKIVIYTESTGRDEWAYLADGEPCPDTGLKFREMFTAVTRINPITENQKAVYGTMLDSLIKVSEKRQTRLSYASVGIPPIMSVCLVIGGIIVVGFTLFFGSTNVWAQAAQAALIALLIALSLYIIANMDHPYTGTTSVGPEAFKEALKTMWQIK